MRAPAIDPVALEPVDPWAGIVVAVTAVSPGCVLAAGAADCAVAVGVAGCPVAFDAALGPWEFPPHPASKSAMARLARTRPSTLRLDIPIPPSERIGAGRFRQWLGVVPAAQGVGHVSKRSVLGSLFHEFSRGQRWCRAALEMKTVPAW